VALVPVGGAFLFKTARRIKMFEPFPWGLHILIVHVGACRTVHLGYIAEPTKIQNLKEVNGSDTILFSYICGLKRGIQHIFALLGTPW